MKRLLVLFTIISQVACNSKDTLDFKVHFNPETKYIGTIQQSSEDAFTYTGTPEFLNKLKEKGIQNPTIIKGKSRIESILNTGKLDTHEHFPIVFEITSTTDTNINKSLPAGSKVYGIGSLENPLEFDSISSKGIANGLKKDLLAAFKNIFTISTFPSKRISVGEDFSRTIPISFQIAGTTLNMDVTTSYKLLSISNGIGTFDVIQVYSISTKVNSEDITATGEGKGLLLYDIKNNYYSKYQIEMNMKTHFILNGFTLDGTTKSNLLQTNTIQREE
jgi:hypothetical protein